MRPRSIALISGPVSGGKSTLARRLEKAHGFIRISTKMLIQQRMEDVENSREVLQAAGNRLDKETDGEWVAEELVRFLEQPDSPIRVVVDAVRHEKQVKAIRRAFGRRVKHIHLHAPTEVLAQRYEADKKNSELRELEDYNAVQSDPTEKNVERLRTSADIVIDTGRTRQADVAMIAASQIGIYDKRYERLVDVLVGAQYGSEGKGQVAAYLSSEYDVLVRVGGPNAGHSVWAQPEPHTFHHLPSGTASSEAQLIVGPGAVIRPNDLIDEISAYNVSVDRLTISPAAMIVEESDEGTEEELKESIASTGQGVGAATSRKVMRTKADPEVRLAKDVDDLAPFVGKTGPLLEAAYARGERVLLEGTQGTHLSLHHGSYPYVTSRDTTVAGCLAEAGIPPSRVCRSILVCRTYPIRVQDPPNGTSGPLKGEISWEEVAERSGVPIEDIRETEVTTTTNRERRVGEFDWELLHRASAVNGPTDVALTFTDYLDIKNREARRFEQLTEETILFIEEVQRVAGAPVSLISTRFHRRSIIDRRNW